MYASVERYILKYTLFLFFFSLLFVTVLPSQRPSKVFSLFSLIYKNATAQVRTLLEGRIFFCLRSASVCIKSYRLVK